MPNARTFHWGNALHSLRADRIRLAPGVLPAKLRVEGIARIRGIRLLTATGAYDRAAIMAMAVMAAKAHQENYGTAWGPAMSAALKGAWIAARAARYRATH